jgi:hypothetical protein
MCPEHVNKKANSRRLGISRHLVVISSLQPYAVSLALSPGRLFHNTLRRATR